MNKQKQVESLLLIALIAFTTANIATEFTYLLKLQKSCKDVGKKDCDGQKDEYLFSEFRNITMKLFCDPINLFVILSTSILLNVLKKPIIPIIPRVCFFTILILTLMSLGSGIRSIDQEDDYNEESLKIKLPMACSGIQQTKDGIIKIEAGLAQYEKGLLEIQNGIEKLTPGVNAGDAGSIQMMAGLEQKQIQVKQEQAGLVKKLAETKEFSKIATLGCKVGNELQDIYMSYRNSVVGLGIVNFVIAYTALLQSIFWWNYQAFSQEKQIRISKSGQEFKTTNNLKSDAEMNAQNAG